MQIRTAVKRCYFAVEPCIVYNTRLLLPVAKTDVLPAFHQSNIVHQFLCQCDSRYVGSTSQRLQQRIKQHVPKTILQEHISQDRSTLANFQHEYNYTIIKNILKFWEQRSVPVSKLLIIFYS